MGDGHANPCASCGAEGQRAARFCPRCGAPRPVISAAPRLRAVRARPLLVAALVGAAALLALLAAPAGRWLPSAPQRAGAGLEDATVELGVGPVTGAPRTPELGDDGVALDAPEAADDRGHDQEHQASCRRTDAVRSPCGAVVPVGHDGAAEVVVLREDLIVLATSDELVGIGLPDGLERWRTAPFTGARAVRVADDGDLLVAAVRTGLSAIDPVDGTARWHVAFPQQPSEHSLGWRTMQGPARASDWTTDIAPIPVWAGDGGVLVLDESGRLHAFDRDDGEPRWNRRIGARPTLATSRGLLTVGREGLQLWHPDVAEPRWRRSGTDLRLHPAVRAPGSSRPTPTVAGPLPLTSGRKLIALDGGLVDLRGELRGLPDERRGLSSTGPVHLELLEDLAVIVTWPMADDPDLAATVPPRSKAALVTAFDADGRVRWQQDQVPLPCCVIRSVPAARGRIVLAAAASTEAAPDREDADEVAVMLDASNGRELEVLRRAGGRLAAVSTTSTVWRHTGELIGLDRRTGREAFRASGQITSADPLLLVGSEATIVVHPGEPIAPSDVARPGPRR